MDTAEKDYRQEFIKIYNENIKREGADKLLEYLTKSDFFTAPASTRFHSSFEGGLVTHSVKVYERFKKIIISEYGDNYNEVITDESIAIIALLHDVCKVDNYVLDYRNQKIDGQWVQVPYYTTNNTLPYGHGEKSVYIINGFIRLTREEAMAINWHMGAHDARAQSAGYDLKEAFTRFPVALLFHVADMETSYLDEN